MRDGDHAFSMLTGLQDYIRYRREKDARTTPSEWILNGWYQHEMPDVSDKHKIRQA